MAHRVVTLRVSYFPAHSSGGVARSAGHKLTRLWFWDPAVTRCLRSDAVNAEQGDTCRSVRNLVVSLSHAGVTCGTPCLRASWSCLWAVFNTVANAVAYLGLLFQEAGVCGQDACGHFTVSEGLSFQCVPSPPYPNSQSQRTRWQRFSS